MQPEVSSCWDVVLIIDHVLIKGWHRAVHTDKIRPMMVMLVRYCIDHLLKLVPMLIMLPRPKHARTNRQSVGCVLPTT
jgi:hypothetical protein